MGVVGADRFRPHFLAIEWDDMVDAFESGAAVVNFGTFHTPAHPHVECELPAASAMLYTELTEDLEAPHPERRPPDLTGYLQTPRRLPRPHSPRRSPPLRPTPFQRPRSRLLKAACAKARAGLPGRSRTAKATRSLFHPPRPRDYQ
jgi:hypothetical protein